MLAGAGWAQEGEARAKKIIGGSCFLCHGADGESASAVFPRLAGQNADYIARQLGEVALPARIRLENRPARRRKPIKDHEPDVVPGGLILPAGIAQPHDDRK